MGNCCTCIDNGTVGFVEGCGKFQRVATPGFNCLNPLCCEEMAGTLSLRVQQINVECETKTKDNVFVTLVVSVQYQVIAESLYEAFYRLTDSSKQIKSYVFDVVRATVPKILLDDVFITKEEIALAVKGELCKAMQSFGYEILQALVTDIDPAPKVKDAMNEINAAQRLRESAYQRAEADKMTKVKAAEADAEARYLQGQGISRQRQAILNGLRDSVTDFSGDLDGINNKEIMELLLITQYFDTVKDMGTSCKNSTLFMTHSPAAISQVSAQLRAALTKDQEPSAQKMQR